VIVQAQLRKHDFDCFLDTSQPLAPGRKGVVVPGCPYCKKTFYTMAQFIEHISFDVLHFFSNESRQLNKAVERTCETNHYTKNGPSTILAS
jgi:hypothetical protein